MLNHTLLDLCKKPHIKTKTTEENILKVKNCLESQTLSKEKSIRKICRNTDLKFTTVRLILRKELNLFPYKVQFVPKLTEEQRKNRLIFCDQMLAILEENPEFLNDVWFTDESNFHLNVYCNKQNWRIWGSEKPDFVKEKSKFSKYVTVWSAISKQAVIGPYFFENEFGNRVTVNQYNYQQMINDYFIPKLKEITGDRFDRQVFQQDGASCHTAKSTLQLLKQHFGDKLISLKTGFSWPSNSPEFILCDYYLWGAMKDETFREKDPESIEELKKD